MSLLSFPSVSSAHYSECPLCGDALHVEQPRACRRCDWVLGYRRAQERVEGASAPRDVLALILSVVPGAGQIFKGHRSSGAIMMGGAVVVFLFVCATVSATAGAAVFLLPLYWSVVLLHAYWAEDLALLKAEAAPELIVGTVDPAATVLPGT